MVIRRKEVDNHMYKVRESTCHGCTSKDEVENYKEDSVVEKEQLIMKYENMENKELMREKIKISPRYEREL